MESGGYQLADSKVLDQWMEKNVYQLIDKKLVSSYESVIKYKKDGVNFQGGKKVDYLIEKNLNFQTGRC